MDDNHDHSHGFFTAELSRIHDDSDLNSEMDVASICQAKDATSSLGGQKKTPDDSIVRHGLLIDGANKRTA